MNQDTTAGDYKGPFVSLTVPIANLPQGVRDKISHDLARGFQRQNFETLGRSFRDALSGNPNLRLKSILPKVQNIVNRIDSLSVSIFFAPGSLFPVGFSFEHQFFGSQSIGGFALTVTDYQLRSSDVRF